MKRILNAFTRQLIFWILFFNLTRLIFIIYYLKIILVEKIHFWEIIGVFWHAFKLDLATSCYLMIIPFFLLVFQTFYNSKWLSFLNRAYAALIIVVYSLTTAGEMGIYAEWKTKLTYKVVKYLSNPAEIYNSAETGTFFLLLFFFFLISTIGIWVYFRFISMPFPERKISWWSQLLFILFMPILLFLGMRGGIQQIPINQSESYYSDHNILNISAVNNLFNLYISIFENLQNFNHNPYVFFEATKAKETVDKLYEIPKDTTISILKTHRPNIVLLILESWSADLIESLGGMPGITPEFMELEKNGILFDQIYASGSRSEQGMASLFSGFPAHPISSITVQPDKFVKLPSIIKVLEKQGYSTSFYFGGQLIYGNIKSYMIYNGFDQIMEGDDFPQTLPQGKLGIHDEFTLDYMLHDLGNKKQPFFSSLFTLSTHSPWDQPFHKPLNWGDNEQEYINAAYYTDHALGEFFKKAKLQPWFDQTLFVIVADHSHNSYRNWHPASREYHKIPLLFYGNVIRDEFKGSVWHKLGNQHDLACTLLSQMNLPAGLFHFSKNLFNPYTAEFAYFSTDDGLGWIRPNAYFTYDKGPDFYYWWTDPKTPDSIKNEGKAYLQVVFGEYMKD